MDESTAERIFPPTPRRREQARREGRVPRSGSLVSGAVAVGLLVALRYMGVWLAEGVASRAGQPWQNDAWVSTADVDVAGEVQGLLLRILIALIPWFGLLILVAIGSHWLQAGWVFRPERLVEGWQRLLAGNGSSESRWQRAAWSLIQAACVIGVATWRFRSRFLGWDRLSRLTPSDAAQGLATEVLDVGIWAAGTLVLLGLLDYAWRWWQLERSLWMTLEELRREMKEDAGGKRAPLREFHQPANVAVSPSGEPSVKSTIVPT